MKVLVDGVAFQQGAADRGWGTRLAQLATGQNWQLHLLDRGGAPKVRAVVPIPFPSFKGADLAADSALIQRVCDLYGIDAFISTGTTTPLTTPSLAYVDNLTAALFAVGETIDHDEQGTALAHALRYVCPSERLRSDLLALHPEIPMQQVHVVVPAVDGERFRPIAALAVRQVRIERTPQRPYLLYAPEAAPPHAGHPRRDDALVRALAHGSREVDLVCLYTEPQFGAALAASLPRHIGVRAASPTQDELPLLLSEALALFYADGSPQLAMQAMSSDCPVIALGDEAMPELTEGLADSISSINELQVRSVLDRLFEPARREELRRRAMAHARLHGLTQFVAGVETALTGAVADAQSGRYDAFLCEWKRLRMLQANVDFPLPS